MKEAVFQQHHKQLKQIKFADRLDSLSCILTQSLKHISFLNHGSDHIVFSCEDNDNVLIFQRQKNIQKAHQSLQNLNNNRYYKMMSQIYQQIMLQKFSYINTFRWKKRAMYFDAECWQNKDIIFDIFQQIMRKSGKSQLGKIRIDRNIRKVYVSKNIFDFNQFNTVIQFKPKSVLPDCYSQTTLQKISKQMKLNMQQIKNILQKSLPIQKTRWFKKQKQSKSTKLNQNPYNIFKVQGKQTETPNFYKTKCIKKTLNLNSENINLLNQSIFKFIHSSKQFLNYIYQIQKLYSWPYSQIDDTCFPQNQQQRQQIKQQILKYIQNKINNQKYVKLNQFYQWIQQYSCVESQHHEISKQCMLLLFLISLTWRDISVVYRANFTKNIFADEQIWIIDDQLKKIGKVKQNIQKDEKYLKNYLQNKISIIQQQ